MVLNEIEFRVWEKGWRKKKKMKEEEDLWDEGKRYKKKKKIL